MTASRWIVATTIVFAGVVVAQTTQPKERVPFSFTTGCTTKGTEVSGKRHACETTRSTFTAPTGFVIVKDAISWELIEKNGSEYNCGFEWGNSVEIIEDTGIYLPRTLTYWAKARSPERKFVKNVGSRGWVNCKFSGYYVRY